MQNKREKGPANPQRVIFTAFAKSRKQKNDIDQCAKEQRRRQWGTHSSLRPQTTPLLNRSMHETLNTTGRSSNLVHLRSISVVENELSHRYKEHMNPYLRNKFRKIIQKRQESFLPEPDISSTIEAIEPDSTGKHCAHRPLDHFYSTLNSERRGVERGVEKAYVVTAKERIGRLIEMQQERESEFSSLSCRIKARRERLEEARGRNRFEELKRDTIEEEEWDQRWRQEVSRESRRYRNRLVVKCSRQTTPFFNLVH